MLSSAISPRRILVLLVVSALVLLTFDQRGSAVLDGVRSAVGEVVSPVQGVVRFVTRPVGDAWNGITDYTDLERENARLRDQVEASEGAAAAAEAAIYENNQLRTEAGLPTLVGIDRVAAEVISGEPSNFDNSIVINQGTRRGIRPGMPVITSGGVVGRVTSATGNQAVVRLIIDPQMSVSVRFLARDCPQGAGGAGNPATTAPAPATTAAADPAAASTAPAPVSTETVAPALPIGRELGTLVGRGRGNPLAVENVSVEDCIAVGDPVLTSGIKESLFPGGIPVGRVVEAERRPGSLDLDVKVEPFSDLDRIHFVKVLLYDGDAAFADE